MTKAVTVMIKAVTVTVMTNQLQILTPGESPVHQQRCPIAGTFKGCTALRFVARWHKATFVTCNSLY